MPVPGDGRYEWADFRSMDELPRVSNPVTGWFGTSNEMNLPLKPEVTALKLGFEWSDPARSKRQPQLFGGTRQLGVQDVIAAQTDITTVTGQRATALLAGIATPSAPEIARLRTLPPGSSRRPRFVAPPSTTSGFTSTFARRRPPGGALRGRGAR
jgi:penicillin amidase